MEIDHIHFKVNMANGGLTKLLLEAVNHNDGVNRALVMLEPIFCDRHPETMKWFTKFAATEYPGGPQATIDPTVFENELFHLSPGDFMEFMRRLKSAGLDVRMMCLVNTCFDRLPQLMIQALKRDSYVISLEADVALRKEAEEMSYNEWCSFGHDGGNYASAAQCYQALKKQRGLP